MLVVHIHLQSHLQGESSQLYKSMPSRSTRPEGCDQCSLVLRRQRDTLEDDEADSGSDEGEHDHQAQAVLQSKLNQILPSAACMLQLQPDSLIGESAALKLQLQCSNARAALAALHRHVILEILKGLGEVETSAKSEFRWNVFRKLLRAHEQLVEDMKAEAWALGFFCTGLEEEGCPLPCSRKVARCRDS